MNVECDAFKVATTELSKWLEKDYKLSRAEAAIVMGMRAQYDIGEVVDRDYTVAARLPREVLGQLGQQR